jgi:rubrerythrin
MKLWMLKFTHGVEVGAHLAYVGHYARTNDRKVESIAKDELHHQALLKKILKSYNSEPDALIDFIFYLIGSTVRYLCYISPEFMLNKVAMLLELFAVFSYDKLAQEFPDFEELLKSMEKTEQEHVDYFRSDSE